MMLVGLAFVFGVALVFGGYSAVAKLPEFLERRRLDKRLSELSGRPTRHRRPTTAPGWSRRSTAARCRSSIGCSATPPAVPRSGGGSISRASRSASVACS